MNSNIRIFVLIALVLGILVIGIEIGSLLLGKNNTNDQQLLEQIQSLPPTYDQDLLTRLRDREKYLIMNKTQFLGNTTPTPSVTTTASPTPTASVSPTAQ